MLLQTLFVSFLWNIGDSCKVPAKCQCTPNTGYVTCSGLQQVPSGIPASTTKLNLSRNYLSVIPQEAFRNLTILQLIYLNGNNIKGGFYLAESLNYIELQQNLLSLRDLRMILKGTKKVKHLFISDNPIGPSLTADIFAGFDETVYLEMATCKLEHIESGAFQAMKNLKTLDLSNNGLSSLDESTLRGPGEKLQDLILSDNAISSIAEGTFRSFSGLNRLELGYNHLEAVPDLSSNTRIISLYLDHNHIKDISRLGTYDLKYLKSMHLAWNKIKRLQQEIFQHLSVPYYLDLSHNSLQEIPDGAFSGCPGLLYLILSQNNISQLTGHTFTGLKNLKRLMMSHNSLISIPANTFAETRLLDLLLHSNYIASIDNRAFYGLNSTLKSLTLFDNPITSLPNDIFDDLSPDIKIAISCKNLHNLPSPGRTTTVIKCAPSSSYNMVLDDSARSNLKKSLRSSSFECKQCTAKGCYSKCTNCTLCNIGTHGNGYGSCPSCPAGGFYQDALGQLDCKNCSNGTYVSKDNQPGKTATDCKACPYGTLSNEGAGYRACRCLPNFYRTDRFGPCSPCPSSGVVCVNDTAILAPNYYWNWTDEITKDTFKKFVKNIHNTGPDYNSSYSKLEASTPFPYKCPRVQSCKGGIDSECHVGYKDLLCASCTEDYYLRMNTCLKCPSKTRAILSFVGVIVIIIVVFLAVFLGDSRKAADNRTWADVIMSCFKIIIGFYQVMSGIFSALIRVRWPVTVATIATWLKFVEGNILQFAPLSCIHPRLRLDPFVEFAVAISVNVLGVALIMSYLLLKTLYIKNRKGLPDDDKRKAVSNLKRSCYRNIFLFLLTLYPSTATKIVHILPLPHACVKTCFTKDESQCPFFLRADFSIRCFTSKHNVFWRLAAVCALYPVGFPLFVLALLYKFYRKPVQQELAVIEHNYAGQSEPSNLRALVPRDKQELTFGLSVYFENYKFECWYWEILDMYRKLLLTSGLVIFTPDSGSRVCFSVVTASLFGILYTSFRPIKSKFEDLLQTISLWVVFFDVCFAAIFTQPDVQVHSEEQDQNDLFVNVLFVVVNCLVLAVALVRGAIYVKSSWRKLSSCIKELIIFIWRGIWYLQRRRGYYQLQ